MIMHPVVLTWWLSINLMQVNLLRMTPAYVLNSWQQEFRRIDEKQEKQ